MRAWRTVAVVVAAVTIGACGGGDGDPSGESNPTTTAFVEPEVSTEDAKAAIDAAAFDDAESLEQLGPLAFTEEGAAAAAEVLAATPEGAAKWAAVYVYANGGDDAEVLTPYLADADPSVRVLAAAGVVTMGGRAGITVLIDLLTVNDTLTGSTPPMRVWEVAAANLLSMPADGLGPALDADDATRAVSQQAWRDWFTANGARLTFDDGAWSLS